jgi:hypothetical protein
MAPLCAAALQAALQRAAVVRADSRRGTGTRAWHHRMAAKRSWHEAGAAGVAQHAARAAKGTRDEGTRAAKPCRRRALSVNAEPRKRTARRVASRPAAAGQRSTAKRSAQLACCHSAHCPVRDRWAAQLRTERSQSAPPLASPPSPPPPLHAPAQRFIGPLHALRCAAAVHISACPHARSHAPWTPPRATRCAAYRRTATRTFSPWRSRLRRRTPSASAPTTLQTRSRPPLGQAACRSRAPASSHASRSSREPCCWATT